MAYTGWSSFGVDIGVPRAGLSWTRVDENTWPHGRSDHPTCARCANDLAGLAACITTDIAEGREVYLGFEAPMWIPAGTGGTSAHFGPRFPWEGNQYRWYQQAGATTSVVALAVGLELMASLQGTKLGVIAGGRPQPGDAPLLGFEAFVAGPMKLPTDAGFHPLDRKRKRVKPTAHRWDAFCVALAGAAHMKRVPSSLFGRTVTAAPSGPSAFSWWAQLGAPRAPCDVVAFVTTAP